MSIATPRPTHPPVEVAESRLGAVLYNRVLWAGERLGMARRRRALLAAASGAVLEIGAGTGLNLRHYPSGLERLVLAEPGDLMAARIKLSRAPDGVPTRLLSAPAEDLPFDDDTFDTVVSTLVLCTVSDPARAVAEAARVLRPGGRLLFCEHVAADPGWRRDLQRRSADAWAAFADGCRCDRPTLATIETHLHVESVEHTTWRAMPTIVKPLVWGRATA
ncbi:MAG TPA: class I SAM-dependent methyltransferase [Solirubrobacterales bacterium]|jgi:ubiquinone/menaquinone biosynthesis C-methylase UbiE|nr:class I SAM-dependent methyltransferase [Solirubrobacterales bacterium]